GARSAEAQPKTLNRRNKRRVNPFASGRFCPSWSAEMPDEDELAMATRHVREGAERVRRQLERLERLRRDGLSTVEAQYLLANLREAFEWHRWHLEKVISERGTGAIAIVDRLPHLRSPKEPAGRIHSEQGGLGAESNAPSFAPPD